MPVNVYIAYMYMYKCMFLLLALEPQHALVGGRTSFSTLSRDVVADKEYPINNGNYPLFLRMYMYKL